MPSGVPSLVFKQILRGRALQSKKATDHLIQAAKPLDQNQGGNRLAGKIKMRRPWGGEPCLV
jgi:hypothetical protein